MGRDPKVDIRRLILGEMQTEASGGHKEGQKDERQGISRQYALNAFT